ncbi:MAG: DUF3857 domain-containing protein [Planctomycetota bacterium]
MNRPSTGGRHGPRGPFSLWIALVLPLALLGSLLPTAPAQAPTDAPRAFERAFAHAARSRAAAAAAELAAAAERLVQRPDADVPSRVAAEGAVALALQLVRRQPADPGLPRRLLALRASPLARAAPDLGDQIGALCLWALAEVGDPTAPQLARELGYVGDAWICGPFDNERGAALARDLPAETGFDRETMWPGKLRPVGWRRLADASALGPIELGAVLQPSDQTACLVAVALDAEQDTIAALHLGSAGAFVVRLDGQEVARRDVDRRFAPEQDAVALPLRKGPNLLTVKFCHQDLDAFTVALRLSALGGGPLAGVATLAEEAALVRAAARAAAEPRAPDAAAPNTPATNAPPHGARSLLDADPTTDASPETCYWLGMLHMLHAADAEADRRDRVFAERAARGLPQAPHARMLLAATRVRSARIAAELDDNARRADYEAVLTLDPEHTGAAVELGRLLLQSTGMHRRAEALALRALAANPDCEDARILRSDALRAAGLGGLADRDLRAAAARDDASTAALLLALQRVDDSARDQRRQWLERLAARMGDGNDLAALAAQALHLGERDRALQILERARRLHPLSRRPYEVHARLLEGEGDAAAALRLWGRWLQLSPDDDEAVAAQSRLYALLGRGDDQVEALRAAVELNPNRRDDQRYLEFLAAETTPFHRPFAIDTAELRAQPTPAASIEGRDPVHHLLQQRVVQAHRNGTTSEYLHLCVRILTEEGARAWSGYRLPYYYGEQRGRMLSCTVHKASGSTQEPRIRGAGVAMPQLAPGDVVDLEGRIDDIGPSFFGDYFGLVHWFAPRDGTAALRSELTVLCEPGRDYRYQLAHGAPEPVVTVDDDGQRTYAFRMDGLPRDVPEPRRPDAGERLPLVRFTTFRDWDHFASWWWNLIRGQLETSPAMRQKVQELTAGLTTQEQRMAAIYRFVTTDVRYEAWEFGVHGYKPYSTQVIFERRHGDCKDKALLLCALLQEIGVHAAPVLIQADELRSRDDLELPMVQHFNHCIAWLPQQDGLAARYLDGTAIWHPVSTLPTMDQGAEVLVVDAGNALVQPTPWAEPADNAARVEYLLELQPDGSAMAQKIETPLGNEAVQLRAALAAEPARQREHVERALVADFGPVTVGELERSDPLDYGQPVRLQVDFRVAQPGQRRAGEWLLPSTFGREPLATLVADPERTQPLLLGVPRSDDRTVRWRLPPGWRPRTLPDPVERQAPFGEFSVRWALDGDRVVVTRRVVMRAPRIEPADYPALRDFAAALRAADAQRIVLQEVR